MDKHRINQATKQVICQNIGNYLTSENVIKARYIAPDATKSLVKATEEQSAIGWEQWFKGRWANEWLHLVNYDIQTIDFSIIFNTPEKWGIVVISLTWEYVYNTWHERNSTEHNENGAPEIRKKEKVTEHILGISKKWNINYIEKVNWMFPHYCYCQ
jgi:hypothetical protein